MAKRKKKEVEQKSDHLGRPIAADALMSSVVSDMETKLGKKDCLIGKQSLSRVIPVPSLAFRYIIQSEGLPLSSIYQLVGEPGSFKSTMLAEMQRWHRICGGLNVTMEAETKDQDDLRWAILNYDYSACKIEECLTLEEWMQKITWYIQTLQKKMTADESAGKTVPLCLGVDSLTGKASEKTAKKIKETGHAQLGFAIEANMIKTYMQVMPSWLLGWPFNFVGINHLKIHQDPLTGMIDESIAGGWALKFQCLCIFIMTRIGRIDQKKTHNEAKVRIETYKNNMGPNRLRCDIKLKTWNQQDPDTGDLRTHARFEWWEASILLLFTGAGMRTALANTLLPQVKEICDLHEKAGGSRGKLYWSNRLGVPSSDAMPAHELGMILEDRKDILDELYPVLGIKKRKFFEPGVDYMQQLEAAEKEELVQVAEESNE